MKNFLLFIFILVFITKAFAQDESTVFVPQGNGFVKAKIAVNVKSLNDVARAMKYKPGQLKFYTDFENYGLGDIRSVAFKVFSDQIVFIFVDKKIDALSPQVVKNYLKNYSWTEVYNPNEIVDRLTKGIDNQSLTVDYIAGIFNITDYKSDCTLDIKKLGYKLTFKNNLLVNYSSSDGLSEWAKVWKEKAHSVYLSYKNEAEKYWGNNEDAVINEINTQAEAWANVPDANDNPYIKYFRTKEGNVNFKMLMVARYKEPMSEKEFLILNHGRYTKDSHKKNTYVVNNTTYTFSSNGKLISAKTEGLDK